MIEKAEKPISPGTVVSIDQNTMQPQGVAFRATGTAEISDPHHPQLNDHIPVPLPA